MTNINIEEILEKHHGLNSDEDGYDIFYLNEIKAAIKEIIEAVIDKCAEKAEAIEGWNTGFSGSASSIDKESILNVKNLINYD